MKWGKLFLIKLSPDKVIHESADVYREWEQVPDDQKWCDGPSDGWQELYNKCFQGNDVPVPTLKDKVMIIAHGSTTHIGTESSAVESPSALGYSADDLADWLVRWGIGEIGLLTFKACYIGAGTFLEDFVRRLAKKELKVGWLKGYKGPAATIKRDRLDTWALGGTVGKPYESISREAGTGILASVGVPVYGNDRYKIVPGNAAWMLANSRYDPAHFKEVGD